MNNNNNNIDINNVVNNTNANNNNELSSLNKNLPMKLVPHSIVVSLVILSEEVGYSIGSLSLYSSLICSVYFIFCTIVLYRFLYEFE